MRIRSILGLVLIVMLVGATVLAQSRAHLLAQAGATVPNEEHRLASLWLEAMIVVDQKKLDEAADFYEQLAARDPGQTIPTTW